MIVKDCLKIFTVLLVCILLPFGKAFASSPSFSLYPNGGVVVNGGDGFVVDVMIDTGGQKIVSAKFTLLFDPRELQLTKVERNNSLFDQWPEDESTVDNDNGVVMLEGFSQSGSGKEYVTEGDPDIFARLHFKALKKTDAVLDWEYNTNKHTLSLLTSKSKVIFHYFKDNRVYTVETPKELFLNIIQKYKCNTT